MLGHAPTLIREIAAFLQAPAHESIAANPVVTARATELGTGGLGLGLSIVAELPVSPDVCVTLTFGVLFLEFCLLEF